MRRRARRKTPFERFMGYATEYLSTASDYADLASEFARERHPAWWAGLAAAALPLAYYAWPTSKPTSQQQAHQRADDVSGLLDGYLQALAARMPSIADSTQALSDRGQNLSRRMMRQMPSVSKPGLPTGWRMPTSLSSLDAASLPAEWKLEPRIAVPVGVLAGSAMAFYLFRRLKSGSRSARVSDVMTRQPRTIQPDATVADAAAMMRRLDVGSLPVCDGSRLVGMLTDRDITTRSTADGRDPHLTTVRDVMSSGVAWASEDDLVEEAARIMREHRIRRLPIVDDRHSLVGMVSLGDLATDVQDDALSGDTLEHISE